jgi:hypothetical protein
MPLTPGLQIPFGIQPVQAVPVDSWSGPYTGADLATAIAAANSAIPSGIRFQSMEVRLIVGGTSYKYWYKNGTTDSDLVEFSGGGVSSGSFSLTSGIITSGYIGNFAVVSGSIASGQIGINHLSSGLAFKINNESDNRILTSLASGSNQANAESNLTYDGTTLNIQSVASGSTVFNIDGVYGNLFSIKDTPEDSNILTVENASGNLIFAINTEGYQKTVSCLTSGQTSNIGIFAINKNDGNAAFFDYYCKNTLSSSSRAGNISVVWDESNNSIDYTELSTNDINGSTEHLYFSTTIETTGTYSGKMVLSANISSGSWNIKAGARIV